MLLPPSDRQPVGIRPLAKNVNMTLENENAVLGADSLRLRIRVRWLLAVISGLLALLFQANATDIVYTFSGTGTGKVGETTFTNASFSISILADTTNVSLIFPGDRTNTTFGVDAISSQFRIAEIGFGSFSNATYVFVNQTVGVAGWSEYNGGGEVTDILDVLRPASFTNYNLGTPVDPILIPGPIFTGGLDSEPSTLGLVTLTDMKDITFSATFFRPQLSVQLIQAPNIQVCWTSLSNRVYQLEYSSALNPTNTWLPLGPPITSTGTNICVTDSMLDELRRFYRVHVLP